MIYLCKSFNHRSYKVVDEIPCVNSKTIPYCWLKFQWMLNQFVKCGYTDKNQHPNSFCCAKNGKSYTWLKHKNSIEQILYNNASCSYPLQSYYMSKKDFDKLALKMHTRKKVRNLITEHDSNYISKEIQTYISNYTLFDDLSDKFEKCEDWQKDYAKELLTLFK